MQNIFFSVLLLSMIAVNAFAQNTFPSTGAAGVGTTTPDASSLLEIKSTSQGMLIPRMTNTQRNAIVAPATGLLIYQTNSTPGFYYYSGTAWTAISAKGANTSLSNLVSTAVNQSLLPNANDTYDLGDPDHTWRNFYPIDIKFPDGTSQTTGFTPYISGTGISISGHTISNTLPDQAVTLTPGTGISVSGTYPNFTLANILPDKTVTLSSGTGISVSGTYPDFTISSTANSSPWLTNGTSVYYNSGNVGIGTSIPSYKLDVNGGDINLSAGNALRIGGTTALRYDLVSNSVWLGSDELNSTGIGNTAEGAYALSLNKTGTLNTANGYYALHYDTSGSYNTADGQKSLFFNTTGSYNSVTGSYALLDNTTGSFNSANGAQTLEDNTTGSYNSANGVFALLRNTTGSSNTAEGNNSLINNTTGHSNVAIGTSALYASAQISNIVAIGDSALYNNGIGAVSSSDGIANVAVGSKALLENETGRANSALGYQSLYENSLGYHNTSCGYQSLYHNTTGNDITAVGYGADVANSALSNATAIGSSASVSASNCVVLGSSTVTKLGIGVTPSSSNIVQFQVTTAKLTTGGAWTNASDKKLKENFEDLEGNDILARISKLPITRWDYIKEGSGTKHIGPMAQDFYKLFGVGDDSTISTIDPAGVALKGIQALIVSNTEKDSQIVKLQNTATDQQQMITDQQQQINDLIGRLNLVEQSLSQCCPSYQPAVDSKINSSSTGDIPRLDQNAPNPFSQNTTIQFFIPSSAGNAMIVVSDLSGKIIRQFNHLSAGNGTVMLAAGTLASGTYRYSLYIGEKKIDTRQMVLTR